MSDGKPLSRTVQANALQGSEGKTDPEYLKKKEFFDNLRVRVELKCNALRENTQKEAQGIRSSLSLLISQLPSRVQKMTVKEFCKEFGFELVDGTLALTEENAQSGANAQSRVFHTVTKQRRQEFTAPYNSQESEQIMSQMQIIHKNGLNDAFLRLTKNNTSYDLSKQKMASFTAAEREMIEAEVIAFTQLLKSVLA
ncbi:hypothetical protein WA577_001737 [Blastocystis sp. JDR]